MYFTWFLIVYVMARENFLMIGIALGSIYVVALFLATVFKDKLAESRQQAMSFLYSLFLLVFIMAWGVSAQAGILHGWPSGKVQSTQCSSSNAKPRPSSIVSTWNRSSTSSSMIASCWMGSYTRIGLDSRPSCLRSLA